MKKIIIVFLVVLLILSLIYTFREVIMAQFFQPTESAIQVGVSQVDKNEAEKVQVVLENLDIPWELDFLPNGEMLITERKGRLLIVSENKQVVEIEGVAHVGEGGLLGLAVHPEFKKNNWLYLYLTTRTDQGLTNRVERYQLQGNNLVGREVIIQDIPGAQFHDGGRIKFGPDGKLYINTGDAGKKASAQDINSLAGKILRLNDDGSIPNDNPKGNFVYSFGHRNPQGLAWDRAGRLWVTEHGPSGAKSGFDEINLIKAGANYGWPEVFGQKNQAGMVAPVAESGDAETWAPAGAVVWDNSLFFAGLRGETLYEAKLQGENILKLKRHFPGKWGRLRSVTLGPDAWLYITTSNRDGRGEVRNGDDKVIKINPEIFRIE